MWHLIAAHPLLWMDDVVLMHDTPEGLQELLDITDRFAKKYHIEFGKDKSKYMVVGKKGQDQEFNLGDMKLERTDRYKYLGEILNETSKPVDQIKEARAKAEAALQTIFTIAGDKELKGIEG